MINAPVLISRARRKRVLAVPTAMIMVIMGVGLTGCQHDQPSPGPSPTSPASRTGRPESATPSAGRTGSSPTSAVPPEPTTTNTLPPPKVPTAPAPKTSGKLTGKDLPVPKGWRTVARKGGAEEGYVGNGSWTHARDPRYAAQDVITIGCASITRDDYPDPVAALEGTYGRKGAIDSQPGVGEVLQFRTAGDARSYYQQYLGQVRACNDPRGQVYAKIIRADHGLIDRRVYDGSTDWTEVAKLTRARLTLVILTDPGHKISTSAAAAILAQINS